MPFLWCGGDGSGEEFVECVVHRVGVGAVGDVIGTSVDGGEPRYDPAGQPTS